MKNELISNTELASYFLWEYTKNDNAISMWYCAEDMCIFFERSGILDSDTLFTYARLPKYESSYISFVRNISYRIFIFSHNPDHLHNWFAAERLLTNREWCNACANVAGMYRLIREANDKVVDSIRTSWIRQHLS